MQEFAENFKKGQISILLKFVFLIASFFLFITYASAQNEYEELVYYGETSLGEMFNFGGNEIRFKEVIVDSRCPTNVTCIWTGEAKILVEIYKNEGLIKEEIISTRSQKFFSISKLFQGDFSLTILWLLPYPKASKKIKPSDYQLRFKITQKVKN
ncbi:hypothetical protein DET49_11215 [Salegentibacter sp. 24]|jgi:hypothetical protein|uniref:hypothetical protein n=1 Tax=Salegentibacter sp. 24 TaxID=2183986 RepID=UPI00105DFF93|nr:hypothetical protein [Salegentibacter sp. 24]TDN87325.1 hypothetical protein DET49_11215 [Salegentibacter sp. 24]